MPRTKQEAAKRKKRIYVQKRSAFPVPVASETGEPPASQSWFFYTGYIQGSTVVVRHSGDMDFLHKMVNWCQVVNFFIITQINL